MKVFVTGSTGFVGSHAVEALLAAGHRVRLLVRDADKAKRILGARGVDLDDVVFGDMTDAGVIRDALSGCDAVLHAAAELYGGDEVLDANVQGVRNTVGIAAELGLDPILHVSTVMVMYPPPGDVIRVDDPIVNIETTYGRSKAEGERFSRGLQAEGLPVVTIYPAGVFGPEDPGMGETSKAIRDGLRIGWPMTTSGVSVIDVRDLAATMAAAMEPGHGPRRFMVGGHFVTWPEFADICDGLTGRRARRVPMPPPLLRGAGLVLDWVKKIVPFEYPLTYEAALMMTGFVPCDSERTLEELGVHFRPTSETFADAIRWLHREGHLDAKVAGRLASGSEQTFR